MEKEQVKNEKSFSQIEQEMKARGFIYAGVESLTETKLDSKDARFKPVEAHHGE